eukprot:GHVQ01020116.1.p1 GENE.GHVQ01020116.1~~GHVQ01020116.1.p1  ORF type:complete len:667 (+),score=149.27 GHVQ01020116.1:543-2543(+)
MVECCIDTYDVLVIDSGSHSIKIGYSGEDVPRVCVANVKVCQTPKYSDSSQPSSSPSTTNYSQNTSNISDSHSTGNGCTTNSLLPVGGGCGVAVTVTGVSGATLHSGGGPTGSNINTSSPNTDMPNSAVSGIPVPPSNVSTSSRARSAVNLYGTDAAKAASVYAYTGGSCSYNPSTNVSVGARANSGGGGSVGCEYKSVCPVSSCDVTYPIRRGVVQDKEALERIWDYSMRNLMHIDLEDFPVLLVSSVCWPLWQKEWMQEVFMEKYRVKSVAMINSSVLSLFSTGRCRGLVLESGHGVTSAAPVFDGFAIPYATFHMPIAGGDITADIARRFSAASGSYSSSIRNFSHSQQIMDSMKQKVCCLASSRPSSHSGLSISPIGILKDKYHHNNNKTINGMVEDVTGEEEERSYELPDGNIIQLNNSLRYDPAEVLFDAAYTVTDGVDRSSSYNGKTKTSGGGLMVSQSKGRGNNTGTNGSSSNQSTRGGGGHMSGGGSSNLNSSTNTMSNKSDLYSRNGGDYGGGLVCRAGTSSPSSSSSSGQSRATIISLIESVVSACDPDLRSSVCNQIILAGGTCMLPGMTNRMQDEVNAAMRRSSDDGSKLTGWGGGGGGDGIEIVSDSKRKQASWVGGSMFSSLSTFDNFLVSRAEYEEGKSDRKMMLRERML